MGSNFFCGKFRGEQGAGTGNGAIIGDLAQIRRLEGWSKLVRRRI